MQTNALYAKSNVIFLEACEIVRQNLPDHTKLRPTTRQASKFRMGIGNLPMEVRT